MVQPALRAGSYTLEWRQSSRVCASDFKKVLDMGVDGKIQDYATFAAIGFDSSRSLRSYVS